MDHSPREKGAAPRRRALLWSLTAALLLWAPSWMPNPEWLRGYTMTGLHLMLALGLNVVAGFAGLLDLAYVAFFGIGGYLFAILSSGRLGFSLPFLVTLPLASFASMGLSVALGATTVRLRGEFLAILTLAFTQVFRLALVTLDRPVDITGGLHGLYGFAPIRFPGFPLSSAAAHASLIWLAALTVMIAGLRLRRSPYFRCWQAIREDPLTAEALGVNTSRMKLRALAFGAFIAGAAGVMFASFQNAVFPSLFDFPRLVTVYCMIVLGGLGSVAGAALGAVLLSILPEVFPAQSALLPAVNGLLLIVLMALRPRGIFGSKGIPSTAMSARQGDEPVLQGSPADPAQTLKQEGENRVAGDRGGDRRVILQVEKVSRHFGGVAALDKVSFHLCRGEILSIVGPNGSGKTTLLNMISGFYPPLSGAILHEGKSLSGLKPHRIAEAGIARTFQSPRLFRGMSVLDNLKVARFCGSRRGFLSILLNTRSYRREERETSRSAERTLALAGELPSADSPDRVAASLSHVGRKHLEMALAISTGPKLLLLDEPSAGLSPAETEKIFSLIRKLREDFGCTILLVEQALRVVKPLSDRVIALACGRKIAEGSWEEVARNAAVIQAYHGSSSPR